MLTPETTKPILDHFGVKEGIREDLLSLFKEMQEINFDHDDPADWCEYDGQAYFDFRDQRSNPDGRVMGKHNFQRWVAYPDEDDRVRMTRRGTYLFRKLQALELSLVQRAA